MNFDALPASRNGDYCGVLLLRTGDPLARSDTSAVELRALLDESLPAISALLSTDDVETVAKKAPSSLPAFRTVRPRLHHRECALLLGDAVHTVKPYFGLGANSAFEDVIVLGQALDAAAVPTRHIPTRGLFFSRNELGVALREFSRRRAADADALVRISRGLDRPGKLGFITFVLPIILDGISNKIAPSLFMPNTIAMLQKDEFTFSQVAQRKRQDRAVQTAILASALSALAALSLALIKALLKNLPGQIALVLAGLSLTLRLAKGMRPAPVGSPADVLNRYEQKGGNAKGGAAGGSNEDFLMSQRISQQGYGKAPAPPPPLADGTDCV
ncbi:hypothetical protein T492DRAFT_1012751 [Pavlovales sp. CCMP2436]|nr:hypothetical protein T492DRAFT_1012751 [Pavlovales sp. CCMP2436]